MKNSLNENLALVPNNIQIRYELTYMIKAEYNSLKVRTEHFRFQYNVTYIRVLIHICVL